MDTFLGLTSVSWVGIYTLLTAGLLATAVIASLYAQRQWRLSREQNEAFQQAQLELIRPVVVVAARKSEVDLNSTNLSIKNIGARPAVNVRVTLDPPPRRAHESTDTPLSEMKMLAEPIKLIAPDQELTSYFDSCPERKKQSDLPCAYEVTVEDEDMAGNKYSEVMILDLDTLAGSEHLVVRTMHNVALELERIRKALEV